MFIFFKNDVFGWNMIYQSTFALQLQSLSKYVSDKIVYRTNIMFGFHVPCMQKKTVHVYKCLFLIFAIFIQVVCK